MIKISHIGIAVSDLDKAIQTYKLLGFKVGKITKVNSMDVKVAFIPIGESRFELLEPLSKESAVSKFLEKRGEGIHHVCIEVKNIKGVLKNLKQKGFNLVYNTPQKSTEGLVSFIHPKSSHGVLIEICEKLD